MAAGKISLSLKGFDTLLEQINKAGANINQVVNDCMQNEINITEQCLKDECEKSGVHNSITRDIKSDPITWEGDRAKSAVGWNMGEYDPQNPSSGYKAVFLNYGTAKRTTNAKYEHIFLNGRWVTVGTNRGAIESRGFIARAKKSSKMKSKKAHQEALDKILEGLK